MGASAEQINTILKEAGYQSLYPRYADLPHDYLRQVREMLGEKDPKALEEYMSSANRILSGFDLTEDKISERFGTGSTSIARHAYNLAVLDFVLRIPARRHAVFLHESEFAKEQITSAYLQPGAVGGVTVGIISTAPMRRESFSNMLYSDLLGVEKSQAMQKLFDWIDQVHSNNKSHDATRILGEEDMWFFENNFTDEIISVEKDLGHTLQENMTILCMYNTSKLNPEHAKELILSHSHVILEEPLRVYQAPSQKG